MNFELHKTLFLRFLPEFIHFIHQEMLRVHAIYLTELYICYVCCVSLIVFLLSLSNRA